MGKPDNISPTSEKGKQPIESNKPNLPRYLFWDQRYDDIDWENGYRIIIARVIERGNQDEWQEMLRFYGQSKVEYAIKNEIKYLPDYAIELACCYFDIAKEQLLCYKRKQTRKGHWI